MVRIRLIDSVVKSGNMLDCVTSHKPIYFIMLHPHYVEI